MTNQDSEQKIADQLLRDLADGKGWDEERWAKRAVTSEGNASREFPIHMSVQRRNELVEREEYEQIKAQRDDFKMEADQYERAYQDCKAQRDELLAALNCVTEEVASHDFGGANSISDATLLKAQDAIAKAERRN